MNIKVAFGLALKKARNSKNLTQEDFGLVSSRTYVSTVERGLKSITLDKLEEISSVIGVQPLTLLSLAYMEKHENFDLDDLLLQIKTEVLSLRSIIK
jgi:transcriptional regulator with XRE-family HTH domain